MSDDEDRTGGGGRGGGTLNTIHKDGANRRLKFLQAVLTTLECVPRVERLIEPYTLKGWQNSRNLFESSATDLLSERPDSCGAIL